MDLSHLAAVEAVTSALRSLVCCFHEGSGVASFTISSNSSSVVESGDVKVVHIILRRTCLCVFVIDVLSTGGVAGCMMLTLKCAVWGCFAVVGTATRLVGVVLRLTGVRCRRTGQPVALFYKKRCRVSRHFPPWLGSQLCFASLGLHSRLWSLELYVTERLHCTACCPVRCLGGRLVGWASLLALLGFPSLLCRSSGPLLYTSLAPRLTVALLFP